MTCELAVFSVWLKTSMCHVFCHLPQSVHVSHVCSVVYLEALATRSSHYTLTLPLIFRKITLNELNSGARKFRCLWKFHMCISFVVVKCFSTVHLFKCAKEDLPRLLIQNLQES